MATAISAVWNMYVRVLSKHPWRAQAATTAVLMGAGDLIAQFMSDSKSIKDIECGRSLRYLGELWTLQFYCKC